MNVALGKQCTHIIQNWIAMIRSGHAGHQKKDILLPSRELFLASKTTISSFIVKKKKKKKINVWNLRWLRLAELVFLICMPWSFLESYFKLKSPARSEKAMAFKVWLLQFIAQSDILKSTNNLNCFIMTQHNCLVMNFFLNAYILYLKIKI